MLYNISENLQRTQKSRKYMLPAIHENCEMVNIEYKATEKSEFLAFYFENERDEQVCHTEWKARELDSEASPAQVEAYTRRIDEQITRIHKIISIFMDTSEWEKQKFNSFEALSRHTISSLGDKYKGKKVRIKVVYDLRNFTSLPKYITYPWIESMDIPKENSEIQILSIDKLVKSETSRYKEGADNVDNKIEKFAAKDVEPVFEISNKDVSEDDLPFS